MAAMTEHKIITGDSRDLSAVPDSSVNLIVTSPPYPMIQMWDGTFAEQDPQIKDALDRGDGMKMFNCMHGVLNQVWSECDRVLSDHGFVCINIGDAARTIKGNFMLFPNHAKIIDFFSNKGYCVLPDIHWRKCSNAPNKFMGSGMYPAGAYVTYEHEYILLFRKGSKRVFTGEAKLRRQKSAYFWEERNLWFSDLWDISGTSQSMNGAIPSRARNGSFPFEIPYRLVNMYSIEGDTVLDPFAGLGTTNLACMCAKRNSIGVERDLYVAKLALEYISVQPEDLNKVINHRLSNHEAFIAALSPEKREKVYDNPCHNFKVRTRQETALKLDFISSVDICGNILTCHY